jgi:PAS domain S-box-containing protein
LTSTGGRETEAGVRLAIDHDVVAILVESETLAEALSRLLDAVGRGIAWHAGSVWEPDEAAGLLTCTETWQAPGVDAAAFQDLSRQTRFARGVGLPGRSWERGRAEWIGDVLSDPNFPRAAPAEEAGLHTGFAFPLTGARGVAAIMEFFNREILEPDGELIAAMAHLGEQIGLYVERKRGEESLRRSDALKTAMLESALDCVVWMDHEGRIVEFNRAAEETFGYTREEAIGSELAELVIPPGQRERHRRALARYLATGTPGVVLDRRIEMQAQRADGSEFPVELGVTRIGTSEPPVFTAYLRDITERQRTERVLRFLAEASAALDASLDLEATLQRVAELTVPFLADGCLVDLLDETGELRRAGAASTDPGVEAVLRDLQRHRIRLQGPHPIARAARTGELQLVEEFNDEYRQEIAEGDSEYLEALRAWPARSAAVAPLKARGRLLGTIALASFGPASRFGPTDIAVIEELARRAAVAVDNARLFAERAGS